MLLLLLLLLLIILLLFIYLFIYLFMGGLVAMYFRVLEKPRKDMYNVSCRCDMTERMLKAA